MVVATFFTAAAFYALSAVLYVVFLVRGSRRLEPWAAGSLAMSVLLHLVFLASSYVLAGRPPVGGIHDALAVLSLLIAVAYLATMRRHRLAVIGAFITPVTLLLFLGSGFRTQVAQVPADVHSAMLPLHVGVNILGMAAFALAFAVAVAYVIQERLLRLKRLGGVFHRLPPLHVLDKLGLRLVTIGFPLFTLGVVTGSIWAARIEDGSALFSAGQGFALVAWLFFGTVLVTRVTAGWRGRRAAIGTMLGFLCSLAALAGYVVRDIGGL